MSDADRETELPVETSPRRQPELDLYLRSGNNITNQCFAITEGYVIFDAVFEDFKEFVPDRLALLRRIKFYCNSIGCKFVRGEHSNRLKVFVNLQSLQMWPICFIVFSLFISCRLSFRFFDEGLQVFNEGMLLGFGQLLDEL